jgi:plasmid stabilization system protein ParE
MINKLLEIHPAALAELKSAVSWYASRSEAAAVAFAAELDRAMVLIIKAPKRWPEGDDGTRKFVFQRFPFAIVYREKKSVVQVLAVAHGYRRPGYWKERL